MAFSVTDIFLIKCALANPCYEPSECENLSPGYRCGGCPTGYRGNAPSGVGIEHAQEYKHKCEEIDECAEHIDTCDPNSNCINTPVSEINDTNALPTSLTSICRIPIHICCCCCFCCFLLFLWLLLSLLLLLFLL